MLRGAQRGDALWRQNHHRDDDSSDRLRRAESVKADFEDNREFF